MFTFIKTFQNYSKTRTERVCLFGRELLNLFPRSITLLGHFKQDDKFYIPPSTEAAGTHYLVNTCPYWTSEVSDTFRMSEAKSLHFFLLLPVASILATRINIFNVSM